MNHLPLHCRQEANTIMVHCRMLDATAQQQQEALGVLGVNIVHGALTYGSDHAAIISYLMDDLNRSRMEVGCPVSASCLCKVAKLHSWVQPANWCHQSSLKGDNDGISEC